MLLNMLSHARARKDEERRTSIMTALLHYQARIGGKVFGPIPKDVRREFFCLDEHTWVWHEEWKDTSGRHAVTTRYDVRPSGVLKSQGTSSYQRLTESEARNLYFAIQEYGRQVLPELQRLAQIA